MDYSFLSQHKIIPVVVLNSAEETLPKLSALLRGGISVAEITFRTACAEEAVRLAVEKLGGKMLIGAGTVINATQCENAIESGVKFIVSPGLSEEVYRVCEKHDVPYLPGVVSPTEIIAAKNLGLNILKFFPAEAYGGVKTLKAMSSAFPDVKFLPTGGIDENNFLDYLTKKFVVAVGGSWMMKGSEADIETLSRDALKIMEEKL